MMKKVPRKPFFGRKRISTNTRAYLESITS
jgi:hypothetical protein